MRSIEFPGTTTAPSPKTLQVSRIAGAGVSPSLAVALADLFFPATKRDHVAELAAVTSARCASFAGARG